MCVSHSPLKIEVKSLVKENSFKNLYIINSLLHSLYVFTIPTAEEMSVKESSLILSTTD